MSTKHRLRFLTRFLLATISLAAVEIALAQTAPVTGVRPATTAQPTTTTRPAVASPLTPIVPPTLATPLPQLPPPRGQAQVNMTIEGGIPGLAPTPVSATFGFYTYLTIFIAPTQISIPPTVFPPGSAESNNANWAYSVRPGTRSTHPLVLIRRPDAYSGSFKLLYQGIGGLMPGLSANSTITVTFPNTLFGMPTQPDAPPTLTYTYSNLFFGFTDPTHTTLWAQWVDPTTKQTLEGIVLWGCAVSTSWQAGGRLPPCP